jgi:hypothetical protein
MGTYTKGKSESNVSLKLVGKTPPEKLHLGSSAPSDDVTPGKYLVQCTNAWREPYGDAWRVVWQFQICDGPHDGVGLRKWKSFDRSGEVPLNSEYAQVCEIALERPPDHSDDLNDPASIFAGKKFVVFVGYRKTEKPRGGRASDELALRKKDSSDKLKVHEILSLVKL